MKHITLTAVLLFVALLSGCSMIPPVGEWIHPCSDEHPCGEARRPKKKCTPVELCGLRYDKASDSFKWVCESSATSGAWPPICAEDEKKQKP